VLRIAGWAVGALLVAVAVGLALGYRGDLSLDELKPRWATGASRFVDMGGTTVHHRIEGSGPTVVLLHGTGSSLHTWDAWTAELSRRYRVVRLDLPGFGLTGPDGSHDYTMAHYVAFLTDFLDRVGADRVHLVGNSFGGRIAWRYALAHPERVRSLVLIDSAGYKAAIRSPAFRLARVPGLAPLVRWITPRWMVRNSLLEVYGDDGKITDDLVERYLQMLLRAGNREALIERLRTEEPDDSARIAELRCPTLILWGEADAWIPVAHARRFHDDVPGSELVVYPGIGHVPMEESPSETMPDLLRFLDAH
jgi:pimeloyl-ACP methyl ester carboxylesterase